MNKVDYLLKLPVTTIQARTPDGKMVDVLVDGDYDGEYFSQFTWRVLPNGYVQANPRRTTSRDDETGESLGLFSTDFCYLHQMVLPPKKGYWVTFRNGNKFDCRSANLYYRTPSESALTRKQGPSGRPKTRKYRGVQPMTHTYKGRRWASKNRWIALHRGKYLGSFGSEEEAARAYDKVARESYGDQALLNFPEEKRHGKVQFQERADTNSGDRKNDRRPGE